MEPNKNSEFHEEITLQRLEDLDGYKVAEGYDNVTGWKVVANNELPIGRVRGLIASKEVERVLYLDIEVEKSMRNNNDSHLYILIPIGLARINHDAEIINVDAIDAEAFVSYPRYDGSSIHVDYENLVHAYYAKHPNMHLEPFEGRTAKYYDHELLYNPTTVYMNRTIGF